jgi:hypothetical protein
MRYLTAIAGAASFFSMFVWVFLLPSVFLGDFNSFALYTAYVWASSSLLSGTVKQFILDNHSLS